MGNQMAYIGVSLKPEDWPEDKPYPGSKPTFDPNFGFQAPRKKRVMKVTEEEMNAFQLPPAKRDYCAHLLMDLIDCKAKVAPFFFLCRHPYHAWHSCTHEDFILRMKEYERERRLRLRQKKLEEKSPS